MAYRGRTRFLISTMLFGAGALGAPGIAMAQDAAGAPQAEADGSDIVVTGSRVRAANSASVSPIVTVGSEEIKLTGSPRVEDVLNSLPSISPSQGSQVNGFGNGTATVDLRQLGATRTLVLIDNKRLMPGDPIAPAADLNNIPSALVKRIDVLTGGASTVYGSDAIAGVVNFVMKRDFEGVAVDGAVSFYQHNNDSSIADLVAARGETARSGNITDGLTKDFNLTIGANSADGKGNVTAYLGYRKTNSIGWTDRDFSTCIVQSDANGHYCGGSGGTAPALLIPASGAFLTLDSGSGLLRPYTSADSYNFAPSNLLQRGDTRYSAGAFAHYELAPQLDVYADVMYMADRSLRKLAPDGVYDTFNVSCSNPLLTADEINTFCTSQGLAPTATTPVTVYRRNVEGGDREYRLRHTAFRAVIGARGALGSAWNYDVYGQYARTDYNLMVSNQLAISRVNKAMDAVTNAAGQTVCASVVNGSDPNCVVYNPWVLGGVTAAALDYMTIDAFQSGSTTEGIVSASVSGRLGEYGIKSPWADSGLTIALGAEYRKESLTLATDAAYSSGEIEGTVVQGRSGSFDVTELFAEVRAPLIEDRPFFHSLALEGGFRYSDYSSAGSVNTYKFGGEWAPVKSLTFRGSYNRAVRAPNLVELFTLQARGQTPTQDPCAGATPTATMAQCANSGVTSAQYGTIAANPSGQYTSLTGGNTNLAPEVADTYTAGLVFTPTDMIPGLTVSADYFNIRVKNYITSIAGGLALNQCVNTGNPIYCALINRDPTSGSLWIGNAGYIDGRNTNAGALRTSGIDINLSYLRAIGSSHIGLNLAGTWLDKRENEPLPGVTKYDCAGYFGTTCGQPSPKWRQKTRLTWYTPVDIDLSLNWRYVGKVKADRLISAIGGSIPTIDQKISGQSYFDLAGVWHIKQKYSLSLSVNNILDKSPPIIGANYITSFSNGGTYPGVYDLLGRYISLSISSKF